MRTDGLHICSPFSEVIVPLKYVPKMGRLMLDCHDFSYDGQQDVLIDETERYFRFLKRFDEIKEKGEWPVIGSIES